MKSNDYQLHLGDCLELMKDIPDSSVDLILTDPPYGTVGGIANSEGISHGMKGKTDWDTAIPPATMFNECVRVLRPNGSLLLFSQEPYSSRLVTSAIPALPFSYRLVWEKDHFANALLAKKAPVSFVEDIVVFFKKHTKHDFAGYHPLRSYAERVKKFIGRTKKEIFSDLGTQGICHFFRTDSTQFSLCTEATYAQLDGLYQLRGMEGFKDFSELYAIDREYRSELIAKMTEEFPKVFNLPVDQKFKSNLLKYRKDYDGFHPTQKPVALLEDLVKTYTNSNDLVLDFTMGSGSTGVACVNTGRRFIGMELDRRYFEIASERIARAVEATSIFQKCLIGQVEFATLS